MNDRHSRWATGLLAVAAVVLSADRGWAVYYMLGPSPDEWGLKYDVKLSAAEGDLLNVAFTLTDAGRLRPVYSATVVAFSLQTDRQGGRSYDVKAPLELKPNDDGTFAGQVQIRKEFADRAMIRILTLTFDGRRQTAGAKYYDIPLSKFLKNAPPAVAAPPTTKVVK